MYLTKQKQDLKMEATKLTLKDADIIALRKANSILSSENERLRGLVVDLSEELTELMLTSSLKIEEYEA